MGDELIASVFEVQDAEGVTCGAGFVARCADGSSVGVTCAHVIDAAGSRPGMMVKVRFYESGTEGYAFVYSEGWSAKDENDTAFLALGDLPAGTAALRLGSAADVKADHRFSTLGFPEGTGIARGQRAVGTIHGLVKREDGKGEIVQVQGDETDPGMSGAPVLDLDTDRVVGMVQWGRAHRFATAIPSDVLARQWPGLALEPPEAPRPTPAGRGAGLADLLALPKEWARPQPPRPRVEPIGRVKELEAVRALLAGGGSVAITAAVQGMAGVGKTVLAEHLAALDESRYPGGVLFETLGPDFRDPALCGPILNRWAMRAFGARPAPEALQLTPAEVRGLLEGHGVLLAVLDDVWAVKAIQPLREALPAGSVVLVTTRDEAAARAMGARLYPLDVLTPEDALALLRARCGSRGAEDDALLGRLAEALGRHALALDIAGGNLGRLKNRRRWAAAVETMTAEVERGEGFGELRLPGDEPGVAAVEASLAISYRALGEEAQRRFRSLGAFAAGAPFSAEAAALVWECNPEEAEDQLAAFAERALASAAGEGEAWRQHSLLRAYALALARRAGEVEDWQGRHALVYAALMKRAHAKQAYWRMLPEYPQLRQAFYWAVERDLDLALDLAAFATHLQENFSLRPEQLAWAQTALARAQAGSYSGRTAHAWGNLGNALRSLAALAGEGRRERLMEAERAYREALLLRTREAASSDYAAIQNNLGLLLSDLAGLSGEDRGERLREAETAFHEALRFRTPGAAPLDYAATQNNLGLLLSDLAGLSGEDRGERLREAETAFREALRFYSPEAAPLAYAAIQNNLGLLLSDLAGLSGEDRGARLREAKEAYCEALRFRTLEVAPPEYAATQNNLGTLLYELAGLAGEDRGARLREAKEAYCEALRFRTPGAAPLDYATTQNNLGLLLSDLAGLAGEDRGTWLRGAEEAYGEALRFRTPEAAPLDYAATQNNRGALFSYLAELAGEDRGARLREAETAFREALRFRTPATPLDYAMTQGNLSLLLRELAGLAGEDRGARLRQALWSATTALSIFQQMGHGTYAETAGQNLLNIAVECRDELETLWQAAGLGELPHELAQQALQERFWRLPEELRTAFLAYQTAQQEAEGKEDPEAWARAAGAADAVLVRADAGRLPIPAGTMAEWAAKAWNQAGYGWGGLQAHEPALAAFQRAAALQPGDAMYQGNMAIALMYLGRLDDAEAALREAKRLDPGLEGLAELREDLEAARRKADDAGGEEN